MNKKKVLYFTLAILFGVFLTIFGGIDDSPGGQLVGLLIITVSIWGMVKSRGGTSN